MALEDYLESEVAIAVAATAAVFSPPVRRVLRRGAVYGLAGLMIAGDALATFAKGVGSGLQQATATAANAIGETADRAKDAVAPPAEAEDATQ